MDPRHIREPRLTLLDWRGHLRPAYEQADLWYRQQLCRMGVLRPEPAPPRAGVVSFESEW